MRILVVEDEEFLQEIINFELCHAGFEVELVSDGNAALQHYRKHGPYELILTDLAHKGPNGVELAAQIHGGNPKQPIALITGSPKRAQRLQGSTHFVFVLPRPYDREQFIQLVRQATGKAN